MIKIPQTQLSTELCFWRRIVLYSGNSGTMQAEASDASEAILRVQSQNARQAMVIDMLILCCYR